MQIEFPEFPKIARLSRDVVIAEKLDGTNASIYIGVNGEFFVGSRTRWITIAAPGFMKPEGVVIYHKAANLLMKKTLEKDEQPKGFRE